MIKKLEEEFRDTETDALMRFQKCREIARHRPKKTKRLTPNTGDARGGELSQFKLGVSRD